MAQICLYSYMRTGFLFVSVLNCSSDILYWGLLIFSFRGRVLASTLPVPEGSVADIPVADCPAPVIKIQPGAAILWRCGQTSLSYLLMICCGRIQSRQPHISDASRTAIHQIQSAQNNCVLLFDFPPTPVVISILILEEFQSSRLLFFSFFHFTQTEVQLFFLVVTIQLMWCQSYNCLDINRQSD